MKALISILLATLATLGLPLDKFSEESNQIVECMIDMEENVSIVLGSSHTIQTSISCLTSEIENTQWFPMDSLECNSSFCLNPEVNPTESTCYILNITWKNKASSSSQICVNIRECNDIFVEDKLTDAIPKEINSLVNIQFEIADKQFCYFDLVKDDEVVKELWAGWIDKGEGQMEFDLSSVSSGSYELQGRFAKTSNSIVIFKN